METTRRTLVRGLAWTAPAVVVASAAPAFAVSGALPCGPAISLASTTPSGADRAQIGGWTTTYGSLAAVPSTSSPYTSNWTYQPLQSRTGTARWTGWVFESWRDNVRANTDAGAAATSNALASSTFNVVKGRTYTLRFEVRGGWGNNAENAQSAAQQLTLTIDNAVIYNKSTRGGAHHYGHASAGPANLEWLDTTASDTTNNGTAANLVPVVEQATFTATESKAVTLTMTTTLYPRHVNPSRPSGANWNVGGDDLMVGIPTVVCS